MITRRGLLWTGIGAIAVGGLGFWGGKAFSRYEIAQIIRRRLSYLQLDEAGIQAFAADQVDAILKKRPTWNRLRYHLASVVAPSFRRFYRSSDGRSRLQRTEDDFVSTYLLSSDFFINGADESRVVHYMAYYDALRACGDPFARPPETVTAKA